MKNPFERFARVIAVLSSVTLSGCLAVKPDANKQFTTQPLSTPVEAQKAPPLPNPAVAKSFKEGADVGYKEGKSWGRDGGVEGQPQEFAIKHMANGWAEQKGKADEDAWKSGWIAGFKRGFASARGGKRSLEESPDYENLSLDNARVGAKLYNNSEKHVATIVTVDKEDGLIYVRYVKSGSIEPKSIAALSNSWFVKK